MDLQELPYQQQKISLLRSISFFFYYLNRWNFKIENALECPNMINNSKEYSYAPKMLLVGYLTLATSLVNFSHIPMHMRSSDPYVSSLSKKICPTSLSMWDKRN